ncbi:MAG: hypothetical protein M3473_00940 [Chloroflexota bacterium]|nr:hypothetical protein [Chloroflexota bacterium]
MITIAGGSVTEATPSSALDQSTFDRRFAEVRERVHRICIGLVGRDSAEDVVHDVYLRARSRQAQLRNPEQFDAWICRSAINLCFQPTAGTDPNAGSASDLRCAPAASVGA